MSLLLLYTTVSLGSLELPDYKQTWIKVLLILGVWQLKKELEVYFI